MRGYTSVSDDTRCCCFPRLAAPTTVNHPLYPITFVPTLSLSLTTTALVQHCNVWTCSGGKRSLANVPGCDLRPLLVSYTYQSTYILLFVPSASCINYCNHNKASTSKRNIFSVNQPQIFVVTNLLGVLKLRERLDFAYHS